jgi:AGZA family xanthine/uracil permease-like MFS transporter
LDQFFGITRVGSTVGREVRAGLTTFLTMAYILFVNPDILAKAITIDGVNVFGQIMAATAIAAAIGTLVMGLVAKYPFALAPGMGLNAFFTFSVVLGQGVAWQTALGCVFLSSCVFVLLSVVGLRQKVVDVFPMVIKRATAAGIGLFLAIIGFANAGIIKASPATLVTLGDLTQAAPRLGLLGLALIAAMLALNVRGAIVLGILVTAGIAVVTGAPVFQGQPFAGFPMGVVETPAWPVDLAFHLDIKSAFTAALAPTILSMFFVDFFDTAGTLTGLADRAGFTDAAGNLPRGSRAYMADGIASGIGALAGTSSTTTYIESMAGIEDGGRTGLTAVTVAILFLLSISLWPLAAAVPAVATAPALIVVGAMMMSSAANVEWNDYRLAIPAFLTMVGMPLTYSIANGIALGIVSYTVIHALTGRAKTLHWVMYVMTILLGIHYGT